MGRTVSAAYHDSDFKACNIETTVKRLHVAGFRFDDRFPKMLVPVFGTMLRLKDGKIEQEWIENE